MSILNCYRIVNNYENHKKVCSGRQKYHRGTCLCFEAISVKWKVMRITESCLSGHQNSIREMEGISLNKNSVTVHCRIDEKTFRHFALFDTFRLKKHWRLPTIFAVIMVGFGVVCYCSGKPQSGLLGTVLTVIGLGMPAVYIGTFLSQVKKKAQALKLEKPRAMYTVVLEEENVNIHNDFRQESNVILPWDKVWGVVRVKNAIYLYATAARAFILPDGQADAEPDEIWQYLRDHLPPEKLTDKR